MDRFSYLMNPPYTLLVLGSMLLIFAGMCLLTGEALDKGRGVVYRAEDPHAFWWDVASYAFLGVFCIGTFLYEIYK